MRVNEREVFHGQAASDQRFRDSHGDFTMISPGFCPFQ